MEENKRPSVPNPSKKKITSKFDSLKEYQFWGYGVGHLLNDLASAQWFFYLLYFLVEIVVIDESNPGLYAGYFFILF